jgi:hypothetical protein
MPTKHKVKQGECISSIAERYGLFPESIWEDPANAELKNKRKDPNILYPGDVVVIRDIKAKEESGDTEKRHRFRKKGVPATLRIKIMEIVMEEKDEGSSDPAPPSGPPPKNLVAQDLEGADVEEEERPRKNTPYILDIDGKLTQGETDDEGMVECEIPPHAKKGRIILNPGAENKGELELQLGATNPLGETSGVKQRLINLGYDVGEDSDKETDELSKAIGNFQKTHGLPVTGEVDETTKSKILEVHGS